MAFFPTQAEGLRVNDIFQQIVRLRDQGCPAVLATLVALAGSGARAPGARMLLALDGRTWGSLGGGRLEQEAMAAARELLAGGPPRLITLTGADSGSATACGGEAQVFLEALLPPPQLLVVGAGHVGRALARCAHLAGLTVSVVDDREQPVHDLPASVPLVLRPLEQALQGLAVSPSVMLVVATRSHDLDLLVLRQALATDAGYIGLLGSRRKREQFFARLRAEGLGEGELDRVRVPVGLAIGAETPGEIAVSIVAELIAWMRGDGRAATEPPE